MTMIKNITLEDKTIAYELKLEPFMEGRNTILDNENHKTYLNELPYLFEEKGDKSSLSKDDCSRISKIITELSRVYFNKTFILKFQNTKDISIDIREISK